MKLNKQWLKDRAKEKTTWFGILTTVATVFGVNFVIPADMVAEVLAVVATSVIGGATVAVTSKEK